MVGGRESQDNYDRGGAKSEDFTILATIQVLTSLAGQAAAGTPPRCLCDLFSLKLVALEQFETAPQAMCPRIADAQNVVWNACRIASISHNGLDIKYCLRNKSKCLCV